MLRVYVVSWGLLFLYQAYKMATLYKTCRFTPENVLWSEMDLTKPKYTNIFSFVGSMMPYYDTVMVGVLYLFNCVEIQYIHISVTILE